MEIIIIAVVVFIIYVISEATGYMSSKGREDFEDDNYSEEIKGSSKGVSEPVITFVELVKNNPKKFWCKREELFSGYESFMLIDKDLKVCYRVDKSTFKYMDNYNTFHTYNSISHRTFKVKNVQNLDWVTDEEWQYVNEHLIEGIYKKRIRRFQEIKDLREKRKERRDKDTQRQKIKDLYIKEEK